MRVVLTCDDVFEVLTRAPFPSGSAEEEQRVESHLAGCHECRQLAEALRPAVGLFHEVILSEADQRLPAYRGGLVPLLEPASAETRPWAKTGRRLTGSRRSAITWSALAACPLLLLLLALTALWARGRDPLQPSSPTRLTPLTGESNSLLASLDLPHACRPSAADDATAEFQCCTECHAANRAVASTPQAILLASAACVTCHQ